MSRGISKKTKKLTLSAMLAALGTVVLLLSAQFQIIDLSMAAIASLVCVIAVIELGAGWAWGIYAVVGTLSVILFPSAFAPWVFVAFLGYYPIIKERVERLGRALSWLIKIVSFNAALVLCLFVGFKLLTVGDVSDIFEFFNNLMGFPNAGSTVAVGIYAFVNAVFILYDIALTRLITLYVFRLRKKLKFLRVND